MTLLCILGMNDFIEGKEFEEGTSEPGGGWGGVGDRGKRSCRGRSQAGASPPDAPHPWREAPGTD